MIVISVHDERDSDFFIVAFVFGLGEGEADGAGVEEHYAYRQVLSANVLEGADSLYYASGNGKPYPVALYSPVVVK